MKKLPIGIQSFEDIRSGYVYIDKTKYIYELISSGKLYFFSRPRRFGKSLLIDTLKCLFEGRKELFEGLWIYNKWDWDVRYPVIRLDMSSINNEEFHLFKESLNRAIKTFYEINEIDDFNGNLSPKDNINYLISSLHRKKRQKVVILIDEYDKPILDNIEKKEYAEEVRDYLRRFYEIFKSVDEHLKFLFITGVSKFSRVSLFSGLNNLNDISLKPSVGTMVGYTEKEIVDNFKDYLDGVDLEKMRFWYNGYNFLGEDRVYNPFDVLQFFDKRQYDNYWFKSGTPSFLIKVLKDRQEEPDLARIEKVELGSSLLDKFDVYTMPIEVLLYQTGYLTIEESFTSLTGVVYRLGIPNFEVRSSLNKELLFSYLEGVNSASYDSLAMRTEKALLEENVEGFIETIKALFAGIPYQNYTKNDLMKYEGYYSSVLYAYLNGVGLDVKVEESVSGGRIDMVVKLPEVFKQDGAVYIMEFKVVGDEETGHALNQIESRGYHHKYNNRKCYLIGLEFSKIKQGIVYSKWKKV